MSFKDHFSSHAGSYARHRPRYPAALFDYLGALAPRRALAWDCAAGNGQAATALLAHFAHVVATDASAQQIAATPRGLPLGIAVGLAESPPLATGCADLVTVAQALHWFDLERFFGEVRRVLRQRGIFAAWSYGNCRVTPPVDAVVHELYEDIVGPYWPPERARVEAGYRDVAMPFRRVAAPAIAMTAEWSADELLGYLGTWSAVARYRAAMQRDPLDLVAARLREAWGGTVRPVRWPLALLVGRA